MNTNMTGKFYAFAGLAVLALYGYFMHVAFRLLPNWLAPDALIYAFGGVFLAGLGVTHLAFAYACCFGVLDSIYGSPESATLVQLGKTIAKNVNIKWQRPLYFGNGMADKNSTPYLLIVCKWRLWICSTFNVSFESSFKNLPRFRHCFYR
jgi:hypothetical protein